MWQVRERAEGNGGTFSDSQMMLNGKEGLECEVNIGGVEGALEVCVCVSINNWDVLDEI